MSFSYGFSLRVSFSLSVIRNRVKPGFLVFRNRIVT